MHSGTCVSHVPWCMPGSLTRGLLWSRWQGKRPRHSRLVRIPQFCVSFERPLCCLIVRCVVWIRFGRFGRFHMNIFGNIFVLKGFRRYYILPCQAPYWWLTFSKHVFAVFFRGCVSERVVSSFCWLTASTLCQLWSTEAPPPSRENAKRKGLSVTRHPIYTLGQ